MTQHIIDTDELEKLKVYASNTYIDAKTRMPVTDEFIKKSDVLNLLANSPQADGMVLDVINQCAKIAEKYEPEEKLDYIDYASKEIRKLLSAYKPQADDVPPDVYDIVVDTGDGIYHTAEVVHFQQSGSKRMIQVRFGDTQADDVRKDAERYRWIRANPKLDICGTDEIAEFDAMIDRAIDKARE